MDISDWNRLTVFGEFPPGVTTPIQKARFSCLRGSQGRDMDQPIRNPLGLCNCSEPHKTAVTSNFQEQLGQQDGEPATGNPFLPVPQWSTDQIVPGYGFVFGPVLPVYLAKTSSGSRLDSEGRDWLSVTSRTDSS